jgi:hypothetical protein
VGGQNPKWEDESLPWEERVEARRQQLQAEALATVHDTVYTRVVTTEEAEQGMGTDFHTSENEWRQLQLITSENSKDLATLKALFDDHCRKAEHMDEAVRVNVKELGESMVKVLSKLDNGINEDLRDIKAAVATKLNTATYDADQHRGQQQKKYRLEILTAITAVCAVAGTLVGILL